MIPEQLAARWLAVLTSASGMTQKTINAIRALPAAPAEDVRAGASRLPDLGAREAALREASQCAIDNQDCSPWEISDAILALIGEKPADPQQEMETARIAALTAQVAEVTRERDEAREDAAKFGGMKVASDHEAATLRDRLAQVEEAGKNLRAFTALWSATDPAVSVAIAEWDAALTESPANDA